MTPVLAAKAIRFCSELFDNNQRFRTSDDIIRTAVLNFRGNSELKTILPKVILINSFYSTQIYSTERIARHILSNDVDIRLVRGDISLIDTIRHGHGILRKNSGKEIDFYSFATKYCALHEPAKFPIVDRLVVRLLPRLNTALQFTNRFRQHDLHEYAIFVSVIDALLVNTELAELKYKRLDQGLWIWAKYLFDRSNLTESDLAQLRASLPAL